MAVGVVVGYLLAVHDAGDHSSCDNADYDEFDNGETKLSDNSDSFLNDGCVYALCFKNYALKEVAGCGYLS